VNHEIQTAEVFAGLFESRIDFLLFRDIAGKQRRSRHLFRRQSFDILFQSIALIGEREPRAGTVQRLGRGPRDRSFVCYAENDSLFVSQHI
jgi:hypothetical protein